MNIAVTTGLRCAWLGSGLASGKRWVGTWPVNRLDPSDQFKISLQLHQKYNITDHTV